MLSGPVIKACSKPSFVLASPCHLTGIVVNAMGRAPIPAEGAQSLTPDAIRAGDEGVVPPITLSKGRKSRRLPGIVDAFRDADIPAQGAQGSHPHAIGTSDKGMLKTFFRPGPPHHLPGIVDALSAAAISA